MKNTEVYCRSLIIDIMKFPWLDVPNDTKYILERNSYVAIVQLGLYIMLRILLLGRGLYIVHETGRRRWFGVA